MRSSSLMRLRSSFSFFNDTATTEIYTLSLHDALPISFGGRTIRLDRPVPHGATVAVTVERAGGARAPRSEEHTSELQSQFHLVCRLLLEKKKIETYCDYTSFVAPRLL